MRNSTAVEVEAVASELMWRSRIRRSRIWSVSCSLVCSNSLKSNDIYGTIKAMFVNSFGWLCEKADSISIPVKALEQEKLTVSEAQGNVLSALFMIVIPVAVVLIGFVVWFRRRSR